MVVFTCQSCNSSLKKAVVEKHSIQSRRCLPLLLTCIDCLKDFRGDEYQEHRVCITEAERYGGKDVKVKPAGVKQNNWMESVAEVIKRGHNDPNIQNIFKELEKSTNVPRKRNKFHNFLRSSLSRRYHQLASDAVFTLLDNEFKLKKDENCDGNAKTNEIEAMEVVSENNEIVNESKKKKKKKDNENINGDDPGQNNEGNGLLLNGCSTENKKSKKDKSKKKSNGEINDDDENINGGDPVQNNEGNGLLLNGCSTENKKSKKDKSKKKSNGEINDDDTLKEEVIREKQEKRKAKKDNANSTNILSEDDDFRLSSFLDLDLNKNNETKNLSDDIKEENKLSKKELKKKKKQEKFQAEINEIEHYVKPEITETEETETKKDKKKKNKQTVDNAMEVEEAPITKKNKKRKAELVQETDAEEKRPKLEITAPDNQPIDHTTEENELVFDKTFKWEDVIVEVLNNRSDKEMSLKRLSKKVIAEYFERCGENNNFERLMKKFNKKIKSIKNVVIFKDKAKLEEEEK